MEYTVLDTTQLVNQRTRHLLPVFLVKLPKDQNYIYELTKPQRLVVRMELDKRSSTPTQYKRYLGDGQPQRSETKALTKVGHGKILQKINGVEKTEEKTGNKDDLGLSNGISGCKITKGSTEPTMQ